MTHGDVVPHRRKWGESYCVICHAPPERTTVVTHNDIAFHDFSKTSEPTMQIALINHRGLSNRRRHVPPDCA